MTWQGGSLSRPAANAAWELVVELRTGFPEIRSAHLAGDRIKAIHCLDRLAPKTIKAASWLCVSWPTLTAQIEAAVTALKADLDNEKAWLELTQIASELEEAIGDGSLWLLGPQY